ncbi:nucleotide-diphospho-sugar transferase-domain-containing protein, partial [Ochromonadaceae sp. CCMP2298]
MLWRAEAVADKEELRRQLQKVAGIYRDPAQAKVKGLEKTVMITACNHGFVNHLHNFKCWADRLGMKFLVMAMDTEAHAYITHNTSMDSYLMVGGAVGEVTGQATEFRSKQFNLITARKKEAVHDILRLGFDVLFSDTDVALVRDPLPYVVRDNVDYAHSLNYMCTVGESWDFHKSKIEGNTGFYFVRSNNNTVKLWADAFAAAPKYPRLDDQAIFWK